MNRRLRAAVKGAILFPVWVMTTLTIALLAVLFVGMVIYAAFPLGPTDSALAGMGVIFVICLAAIGAWAGWTDADD